MVPLGRLIYDNAARLMRQRGLSAKRVAREAGLGETYLRDLRESKSRDPSLGKLQAVADRIGVPLAALISGPGSITTHAAPLVSWVQAGTMTATDETPIADDEHRLIPHSYRHNRVIALEVHGGSMNRVADEGSIILVDYTDRTAIDGRFYVVSDIERGETTFKRIRLDPQLRLEPYSYDDHPIIFPRDGFEIVGRVFEVRRAL